MNTIEPFGYFRALPLGWEDCAETDEGAVALYDQAAIDSMQRQLQESQANQAFCLTELKRVEELMLSECGIGLVDRRIYDLHEPEALDLVIRSIRAEEREACARLCDEEHDRRVTDAGRNAAISIASAIRARNEDQEQTK